ncbi:MAG: hypothetical protein K2O18_15620 [Oscillospiraceae bacterium]|nr:hypothetical protein [Oscillospiraceae bacterium]
MSKVVMSLPKGMIKNSIVGGLLALVSYTALQLLCALFIDKGILPLEHLYPAVCVTAAAASFLGCGYSVLRGKGTSLSVPVVVAVFMTLTLTAAFLTADAISIENGVTGLGLSMAAGGLLAALVGSNLPKNSSRSRRRRR